MKQTALRFLFHFISLLPL